jgi:hypothetical protein
MPAVPPVRTFDQRIDALTKANELRFAMADVKRELRSRDLLFRDALEDPRAQPMTIFRLVSAVPRYGPERTRRVLARLHVGEQRRVGLLTDRQRAALAALVVAGR